MAVILWKRMAETGIICAPIERGRFIQQPASVPLAGQVCVATLVIAAHARELCSPGREKATFASQRQSQVECLKMLINR
jgi:hypothetical protein